VELEALAAHGDQPDGLVDRVQALRNTWNRSVPIPVTEMQPISDRWHAALQAIVARWPEPFHGTELDPRAVHQRLERVLAKVESLLDEIREPSAAGLSQTELLAARLRTALASNAMGGRANQDSKWRNAAETVKDAQATWRRLAAVAGPEDEVLHARFREACRRVNDEVRRHGDSGGHGHRQQGGPRRHAPKPAAFAV